MEFVKLPNSDLTVSQVCIGCWQFNGNQQSPDKTWAAQPEEMSKAIVDKAIELGVNFFDTAEGYLNSECVLGRILAGRRRNVIVATKFGTRVPIYQPEDIEVSVTNSLQRLQTDYLDLYQVHWPSFIGNPQAIFDELKRQQAKGRIRSYGVCNFGPQNIKDAIAADAKLTSNQLSYSMLWRSTEYEILPLCKENVIGVLAYSPLQQGMLSGKYRKLDDVPEGRRRTRLFNSSSTALSVHGTGGAEDLMFKSINDIHSICEKAGVTMPEAALSWLLHQPAVTNVIVGASTPEQVERNVKIVKLQQDVINQLCESTKELKEHFGPNADMWARNSRMK